MEEPDRSGRNGPECRLRIFLENYQRIFLGRRHLNFPTFGLYRNSGLSSAIRPFEVPPAPFSMLIFQDNGWADFPTIVLESCCLEIPVDASRGVVESPLHPKNRVFLSRKPNSSLVSAEPSRAT